MLADSRGKHMLIQAARTGPPRPLSPLSRERRPFRPGISLPKDAVSYIPLVVIEAEG